MDLKQTSDANRTLPAPCPPGQRPTKQVPSPAGAPTGPQPGEGLGPDIVVAERAPVRPLRAPAEPVPVTCSHIPSLIGLVPAPGILHLPDELIARTLRGLGFSSLASVGQVCHRLHARVETYRRDEMSTRQLTRTHAVRRRWQERQLARCNNLLGTTWYRADDAPSTGRIDAVVAGLSTLSNRRVPLTAENAAHWTTLVKLASHGGWQLLELDFGLNDQPDFFERAADVINAIDRRGSQAGLVRLRFEFRGVHKKAYSLADVLRQVDAIDTVYISTDATYNSSLGDLGMEIDVSKLRRFKLNGPHLQGEAAGAICAASSGTHLESLSLPYLRLTQKQLERLATALSGSLSLTGCRMAVNEGEPLSLSSLYAALAALPALKRLDLCGPSIGPTAMVGLAQLLGHTKSLETLRFGQVFVDDAGMQLFAAALGANTTLNKLVLTNVPFLAQDKRPGVVATRALFDALRVNRTLTSLTVEGSVNSRETGTILAEVLRENHVLKELDLDIMAFEQEHTAQEFFDLLFGALSGDCILTRLALCSRGPVPLPALIAMLKANRGLRGLELQRVIECAEDMKELAQALEHNGKITELKLSLSDITRGIRGMWQLQGLCRLIARNKTLRKLHLKDCGIESGSALLAEALAKNTSLSVLDLSGNELEKTRLSALMKVIAGHPSLRVVRLAKLLPDKRSLLALATALRLRSLPLYLQIEPACFTPHFTNKPRGMNDNDVREIAGLLIEAIAANPALVIPGLPQGMHVQRRWNWRRHVQL